MSKCGKCWMRYCSNECSLRHWPVHKPICKNLTSWLETHKSKSRKSKKYAARLQEHVKPGMGFCFLNEEQYAICLRTMKGTCLSMIHDIGPLFAATANQREKLFGPKGKAQRTAEPDATGAARACGSGGDPGETTARACGEPKHTAVEPDVAPVAVAPAVTVIPKDNVGTDAMQGSIRRAAAHRLVYNPYKVIRPECVGFHNLNRDGVACHAGPLMHARSCMPSWRDGVACHAMVSEALRKHCRHAASLSSAAPTTLGPVATPIPLQRVYFCSPVDLGAARCASKFVYDVVWLMYNAALAARCGDIVALAETL